MLKKIKLRNPKSVSFNVRSFCVPLKKVQTHKHTIHAARNNGFTARPSKLAGPAHGISKLTYLSSLGPNTVEPVLFGNVNGRRIDNVFCYSTRPGTEKASAVIAVSESDSFYVPLFGTFSPLPIPNGTSNFKCFETGRVNGEDCVFAINHEGLLAANSALFFSEIIIDGTPAALKVLEERLFVLDADKRTVRFSAPLGMTDFSASTGLAGAVQIDGSLGEIIEMGEYDGKLLLVHKGGFTVLQPAYDPQKFVIKQLASSCEEIIPNTTQTLGGTVYFLTKEGLCSLEHGKITLLDAAGSFASKQGAAVSVVYDNRYYLAFRNTEAADENNNTVLVIEKFFESRTILNDISVRKFEVIRNEHAAHLGILTNHETTNLYRLDSPGNSDVQEAQIPMKWESDWFALTYAATVQFVKQVLIKTKNPVTLTVSGNRGSQRLSLHGSPDVQKINLNMKGEVFKIAVESACSDADISALTVTVGFDTGSGWGG